ncbi:MAG: hypothetical protein ACTHJ4_04330 [Candidatus Nucleicultricaceae bacterium]
MPAKFIKSLSLFLLLHATTLCATTIAYEDYHDPKALQTRALSYYNCLRPADKAFFNQYFNLDDLYGEQNNEEVQKLCALIPDEVEQEKFSQRWKDFRESKISPEDTIGALSHYLKSALLLNQNSVSNTWYSSSMDIGFRTQFLYGLAKDDDQVSECTKALFPLSNWSPDKDLPYGALEAVPYQVRLHLNMGNLGLIRAKSFGKPVAWYLKVYQSYMDRIGEAVAFYRVPHSAQTPRTLLTDGNSNSLKKYFSLYADMGEIFQNIFKARLEFLKTHADVIDDLLSQGFVFGEEVLSLPKPKLDQSWHDVRSARYYFKDETSNADVMRPLFAALPHIAESKQAQVKRQLPLTPGIIALKHLVEAYHAFNKKDEATLDERISILLKISKAAALLSKEGDGAYTFTPEETDLLHELGVNAENKSEYLNRLKGALKAEQHRRHLIPHDERTTSSEELRRSLKTSEIYADLDPESRDLPYQYEYSELYEGSFINPEIKLQKVMHLLNVNAEEFERVEREEWYHKALSDEVSQRYDELFPEVKRDKKVPPYFMWLENKNMSEVSIDLRHAIPQSDMLVEVREDKAFNTVFVHQDRPLIEDGVYLYAIPEDGKLYVFPGERSELMATIDNTKLHEIAKNKYGVDFREFSTRTVHPLLCKGENVFSAGEVQFKDGHIVYINNESGHYCPYAYHLLNGLRRLLPSYQVLFSNTATVGLSVTKDQIAYSQFMASDLEKLKQEFLSKEPHQ